MATDYVQMGTGYGTGEQGAAGVLFIFFLTLVPNALEPSKTPL